MKILYVSQYFPPEMGAPAARAGELSRSWALAGHDVTVLTGFPNHPLGVIPAEYRRKWKKLVACEEIDGVKVVRAWLLPFPNRGTYRRMLNYGSFFLSAAIVGSFLSPPDVVIASSPQLLVGLAGWWIARCKRVPFVFEVRDLWPESLAAVGMGTAGSVLHRALRKVAGFLYRGCDRLVVVSPAFQGHIEEEWKVPSEKISVVPNGVRTELFAPRLATSLRKELGAEGRVVASYIGTMGMAHGLETLIEAASRLQVSAPDVLIAFVGEGSERERLVSLAKARGLASVRFVPQQAREQIPEWICASDICLVLLRKNELFRTVIPSKMLEFMSCGRSVILAVDGQARKILAQANAGIFVGPENAEELERAIIHLAKNAELRKRFGANGRRHILENFSRDQTARAYIALLEEMLGRREEALQAA